MSFVAFSSLERMRLKYVRYGFNPKTHRREEVDLSQDDKETFNADVIDAVLVSWTGIEDIVAPVPCTGEWKQELPLAIKAALQHVATMGAGKAGRPPIRFAALREWIAWWTTEGEHAQCCQFADPEVVRTDPEAFNCDTCEHRRRNDALDTENQRALLLWGKVARRIWLDHDGLTFALAHYTRDWDAEDVLAFCILSSALRS